MTADMYEIAEAIVQGLPQEILDHHICSISELPDGEDRCIDNAAVEALADHLQEVIAYVIAGILDAGSERDSVMEDEQLALALRTTLKDW
jgi:hypothetical protein